MRRLDYTDPVALGARLADVESQLERVRAERDHAMTALYAVRRFIVDTAGHVTAEELLEHYVDPVLALVSGHHPAAGG